jgi:SPP1 gp7 family putative phage head morphogenesis protein
MPGSGKARLGPRAERAAAEIAKTWAAKMRGTLAKIWGRGGKPAPGDLPDPAAAARTVAQTEADTAGVLAKADTYGASGVARYRWVTSAGACKVCAPLAGIFNLGDGRLPPLHPNCRCDVQPETQPASVTLSVTDAVRSITVLTGITGLGGAAPGIGAAGDLWD